MIIWGFRTIFRKIAEGLFHCPKEDADRPYQLKAMQRFFTLFFIPVIPLKKLGEVVECQGCKTRFEPVVLSRPTTPQMALQLADAVRHSVVAVAQADGAVSDAEREMALKVVAQYRNDEAYLAPHLDDDLRLLAVHAIDDQLRAVAGFLTVEGRENVLRAVASVAMANGSLSPAEERVLTTVGAGLGMTSAHIAGVMSAVQQGR